MFMDGLFLCHQFLFGINVSTFMYQGLEKGHSTVYITDLNFME